MFRTRIETEFNIFACYEDTKIVMKILKSLPDFNFAVFFGYK